MARKFSYLLKLFLFVFLSKRPSLHVNHVRKKTTSFKPNFIIKNFKFDGHIWVKEFRKDDENVDWQITLDVWKVPNQRTEIERKLNQKSLNVIRIIYMYYISSYFFIFNDTNNSIDMAKYHLIDLIDKLCTEQLP